MKKIVAIVMALVVFSFPLSLYAAETGLHAVSEQYCPACDAFIVPSCETYDYYYDCGDGTHKYVYGYSMYCSCGYYFGWYDEYEDPDGTPHSYNEYGYCYCGAWGGVTENIPEY